MSYGLADSEGGMNKSSSYSYNTNSSQFTADSEGGMNKSSSYSYNTNSSQFTTSSSASSASAMLPHEG
jgi:hypothetical protein